MDYLIQDHLPHSSTFTLPMPFATSFFVPCSPSGHPGRQHQHALPCLPGLAVLTCPWPQSSLCHYGSLTLLASPCLALLPFA